MLNPNLPNPFNPYLFLFLEEGIESCVRPLVLIALLGPKEADICQEKEEL
jgi:hypothetical protein